MNEILAAVQALLPSKRKSTPSGWISFNAICCHHNGESRDTRQRGGILINPDKNFQYHCFNCNFKAGWSVGHNLSKNTKKLFQWMGMSNDDINRLVLITLKNKEQLVIDKPKIDLTLHERELPPMSLLLSTWADQLAIESDEQLAQDFVKVLKYLIGRGYSNPFDYKFYWSPAAGYIDRVIIPFYFEGKIVGWTARKITEGKPKYLTDAQPGYVFNIDNQTADRKFVIVVEGQFDALGIDGVAIMHNEPNATQIMRINALGKEVIAVPDRDKPGAKLIQTAIDNNWSVSLPPWEEHIKDVADAVKYYGRLYTLTTILHYKESNQIKIQLLKKKLENA